MVPPVHGVKPEFSLGGLQSSIVRPSLASLLRALATAVAVFTAGWAVQAGVLPTPRPAALVAAHVAAWLYRYRRVDSTFSIGSGEAVHGTCVQTWFPTKGGGVTRGTLLRLPRQSTVITLVPHDLDVHGRQHAEAQWLARAQLELAGCPRLLADSVASADQAAGRVRLSRVRALGRTATYLHVLARNRTLIIAFSPKTDEPTSLSISARGWRGRSVIDLTPVTRALLSVGALRG